MVITIGREFGSGGKYIGEKLAQDLKLEDSFFDWELDKEAAKKDPTAVLKEK